MEKPPPGEGYPQKNSEKATGHAYLVSFASKAAMASG
jgi:hypothetical protein